MSQQVTESSVVSPVMKRGIGNTDVGMTLLSRYGGGEFRER